MAYDEGLAQRIREALDDQPGVTEKKMFGGVCFMLRGHMSCGVVGEELMLRVGPDAYEESLARPHAREMDFTGRALKGMVYIGVKGIEDDGDLQGWIDRAAAFATSLPPKGAKPKPPAAKTLAASKAPTKKSAGKKSAVKKTATAKKASRREPGRGK